jgi:hypothetical protein
VPWPPDGSVHEIAPEVAKRSDSRISSGCGFRVAETQQTSHWPMLAPIILIVQGYIWIAFTGRTFTAEAFIEA